MTRESGTCSRFISRDRSWNDRDQCDRLAIANNYSVFIYFLHGDGKFVVGVGVGLLLQDLLNAR